MVRHMLSALVVQAWERVTSWRARCPVLHRQQVLILKYQLKTVQFEDKVKKYSESRENYKQARGAVADAQQSCRAINANGVQTRIALTCAWAAG